ncbi:hypothetical protein KO566_01335 [Flavobacteriaceae bacterium XHP0103]|uniref:hypothetical protein n=1 Tax=Marixanthotalea marina TaxID=2844359 RepID=UPI002989FA0B|nr:hypothetical protein [Marixanthotalea marina]MBU3820688.1 hypothetical protein [Marixanthotalea marina]
MKTFSKIAFLMLMPLLTLSFSQCSSTKKLQNDVSFAIGDVYYEQNNSGKTVFIPLKSNPKNIVLDSIYFQGKKAKLVLEKETYVGRFIKESVEKPDMIMSNEPYAEYGNKAPKLPKKTKFDLKEDECIISYKENLASKYFKIRAVKKP